MKKVPLFSVLRTSKYTLTILGSGSTLLACVLTHRKGIGVEIDKHYCEIAKNRLLKEAKVNQLTFRKMEIEI